MKVAAIYFPFFCLFLGCQDSTTKKKELSSEEANRQYQEMEISSNSEKVMLLSVIKHISYDTLKGILVEYYSHVDEHRLGDSLSVYSKNAIDKISEKYKLDPAKVAALIFSYKYEMLTKEEIGDNAIEEEHSDDNRDDSRDY